MKTPPAYIVNPDLDVAIIQTIQVKLNTISWLTGWVFGKTQKGIHADGLEYPQIYDPLSQADSFDIRPDSNLKAYCFFEVVGSFTESGQMERYNLNLIVWGNLKKIDTTKNYDYTQYLISQVLTAIKSLHPLLDIDLDSFKVFSNNADVFDYTGIKQVDTQYLIRPYTAFRINFDVLADACHKFFNCGGTCVGVDILDQTGTVIHHIADGGVYSVEVLSEIVDTIDANVNSIIDPL